MFRRGTPVRFPVVTLAVFALVGSGLARSVAARASPEAAGIGTVELKVMTFNVEYGGTVIDFDKIVEAAVASDADVIALNEIYAHGSRLAAEAGYAYTNPRLDLISRYPLMDPAGAEGDYVFVQLAPGRVVAIANVHLASSRYSPRRILDGWGRPRVLRNERRTRLPGIRPVAATMGALAAAGIPSFVVGDFNAPSHQDWIRATVGLLPQIRYPVRWPVSLLMERKGFVDTYRAAHPDPVGAPGITWPAARPRSPDSWNPRRDAPHDRIDQVWVSGPATTVASQVVGERGGDGVDIGVKPWGSDHRGVVSTVEATPGTPPVTVAVERRLVGQGNDVTVGYHAPGAPDEAVVIVPSGGDPATDAVDRAGTPPAQDVDGSVTFSTGAWPVGAYDAVLVDAGDAELSRTSLFVRVPGAGPTVDTSRWKFGPGEPITVSWEGARGNRFDWIGIYARDADPLVAYYKSYLYTESAVSGSVTFDGDSSSRWPLRPGRYTAYLLVNDSYRHVGSADFVVSR